jgi:hypothetical protein
VIEPTDEMRTALLADYEDACDVVGCGRDDCVNVRLAAVLAIVERDQPRPAQVLMGAAATARGIADRLSAKPGDGKVWPAMSAGARLVAVRLVELADDADGNGYVP